MASVELKNLTKKFGDFTAVDHINIDVKNGEMIALLGGSGCGKTTILRMIAGFIEQYEGSILVDSREMNNIPAYKRNMGVFFQNYALFPHMNTFDNVAFGLKMQKVAKKDIREKVQKILELVKLTGMEKRYPRELSGGQQQRVALARALVTEPTVLLLDEPLSNLDAKLRVEMQVEIKRIQRKLGITTIIVTHDQEEAVSLADRVIVMNTGKILQVGKPKEVFDNPASLFVAEFMGFSNFIKGKVNSFDGSKASVVCSGQELVLTGADNAGVNSGDSVTISIRPENIIPAEKSSENALRGIVKSVTYKGTVTRVEIDDIFEETVFVNIHDYESYEVGDPITVAFPSQKLLIYKNS
ncbi:MAG: Fe3+/spermidine/putrescine transporter ATP-binding protein [Clostridiales bacterium]|nr:Fe3+/spermidine/putrescine transporter ATP-binding protein [Clostridiales bacterium]